MFEGVIQDSASTATLAAILTAREKITGFIFNNEGASGAGVCRVYCSEQTHSSVDKAVKICGIGRKNLVKIPVRKDFSMDPEKLKEAILLDKAERLSPLLCCCNNRDDRNNSCGPDKSHWRDLQRKWNMAAR